MIIITGASKGIGLFLFKKFKSEGLDVIGTYNSTIDNLADDINSYYKVDISNFQEVANWVSEIKDTVSQITLINCAGVSYNSYAHKADIDKWKKVIEVNLIGTFNVINQLLPIMREQCYGRIINFSSVVATLPTPGVSAYAASKSALVGLTKSLAIENASKGITTNALNLGYVELGMGVNDVPLAYQEKIKSQIPLGRFCKGDEIYNTVDYIMKTEYLNGAVIEINGGLI